ncbi:MAG: TVP38/TMEM64 family protein [Acidobacteriota bacterium]|nr:TVP38/TMEM64 family protein [Acidobacteriota bacterium]MDH3524918.1 TVP38/TMEM64 family protein [Acidobacteriota bacterium]
MTETPIEPVPTATRAASALKVAGGLAALAVLVVLGRRLGGYIPEFAAWVDGLGVWGPIVFAAGYAAATVAFIPGFLLTLAAGAIFGLGKGTVTVFLGASAGACLAFLVARYVARGAVERRIAGNARFAAIDRAVAKEGLKIVTLMRLAPVFPFNLMNYGLGLTKVSFRDYALACFGMIPGTFLYVYYGKALGSLAAIAGGAEIERGAGYWVTFGIGMMAAAAATFFVARIARRALAQEVEDV